MRDKILALITDCKEALGSGVSIDEARGRLLPSKIEVLIKTLDAQGFLEWIKDDREFSYYYYDAQQSGVCAKPAEAAALILEAIVVDALE